MARGVQLSNLLEDLAIECNESTNPGSRTHVRPYYTRLLQRHQEQLWQEYDWPHMRVWRDVTLAAGQSRYSFPSDLDQNRIEAAYVTFSRDWVPLTRSLEPMDYGEFDTDEDERFNPQMKWYLRENDEFEVWPIPDDNNQIVRFVGIKNLSPLVDDADTCDLDGNLIVLFAAAQVLQRRKQPDAGTVRQQAERLLMRLKARFSSGEGFNFNESASRYYRRPYGPKPVDYS